MATDKTMKRIIAVTLVFFTLIQSFYFVNIDMVPSSTMTSAEVVSLLIYTAELLLVIGLSMVITYIIPIICVVKVSKLFVILKRINLPSLPKVTLRFISPISNRRYTYKRLQVIRC